MFLKKMSQVKERIDANIGFKILLDDNINIEIDSNVEDQSVILYHVS